MRWLTIMAIVCVLVISGCSSLTNGAASGNSAQGGASDPKSSVMVDAV